MDYVRERIRRYWSMTYRKTLGVSLVTFSVVIAIGLSFTVLTRSLAVTSYLNYLAFWAVIIIAGILIFLANLSTSHTSTVRYMREDEHRIHSRRTGAWMVFTVIGVLVFFLPLLFTGSSYLEPVTLLFSLGGAFLVGWAGISFFFRQRYHELAIGWVAFWIMFAFASIELNNSTVSIASKSYFSVYVAIMSIVIITGFVGLAFLFNSANESMREFKSVMERIEADESKMAARKRRK
ncbi:MAG: hypothetical protein ABSE71_04520 [Candidatus Micrarchaeaceae archaeon]|jgi:hypothetical protein|nr:hypothetical protein [Candidatus Micrarchaeota archaeon]